MELTERSASQQHLLDLCEVVGHPKPVAADLTGESFTFERRAAKRGGKQIWADVWKRRFFGWDQDADYASRHYTVAKLLNRLGD